MRHPEQILAMPKLELFNVSGKAPNVFAADTMSWSALESVLDKRESVDMWVLKAITHNYDPETGGVEFHSEFLRKPDE